MFIFSEEPAIFQCQNGEVINMQVRAIDTVFLARPVLNGVEMAFDANGRLTFAVGPGESLLVVNYGFEPVGTGRYEVMITGNPGEATYNRTVNSSPGVAVKPVPYRFVIA
jgi:hypothetical protein